MKILYLHQYFKTPHEGGAIRSYHIAQGMLEKGYHVEMITSHNKPQAETKNIDGIIVHYLPVFYRNQLGKLGRIYAFLKFILLAYQKALTISNVDLCYATSTPLTIGYVALWLKRKKKLPFIFEVRDLWPLAPIELGFLQNKLIQKYFFWLESKLYNQAKKVIVLSKGTEEYVTKQINKQKVVLAPNMSDCDFFCPQPKSNKLISQYHTERKFVVGYFGTLGIANHLEYLLDIAKLCQIQLPQLLFLIVGDGSEKKKLIRKGQKLTNVHFLPYGNKEHIQNLLNLVDATYTSFLDIPVLQTNSPNKFFDSLAAGKLTIVNTKGWLQQIVEKNKCGFYANPHCPQNFVDNVSIYVDNISELNLSEQNARDIALKEFDKVIIVNRIVDNLFCDL